MSSLFSSSKSKAMSAARCVSFHSAHRQGTLRLRGWEGRVHMRGMCGWQGALAYEGGGSFQVWKATRKQTQGLSKIGS
jgi:hypothetical protein